MLVSSMSLSDLYYNSFRTTFLCGKKRYNLYIKVVLITTYKNILWKYVFTSYGLRVLLNFFIVVLSSIAIYCLYLSTAITRIRDLKTKKIKATPEDGFYLYAIYSNSK
jgi:hypothetical protein